MRKIRKWSFLGILGVVIAVLFLMSISFTQAQVKIQKKSVKPPPEPEATWAVELPAAGTGGTMLYGDGAGIYSGKDDNIEVTVNRNRLSGPWRKDNDFITYIGFKISNSANNYRYVDFDGVFLEYVDPSQYDFVDPDIGYPCCVFPLFNDCPNCVSNDCAASFCMQDFMNGVFHPSEDYAFFSIDIHATDLDITNMDYNVSYKLGNSGHYHDYINMDINYQNQIKAATYHNIVCSKSAHKGTEGRPFNIWITRTGEDTWRIDVGTNDVDTNSEQFFFFVEEYYYEQGKVYSTLYQGGYFYFTFDLIKNPQSSTPPEAPSGLIATSFVCEQIDLSWTDNSDNESGFEIERGIDGLNFTQIDTVGPNAETYNDTGLDGETQYWYRVRAYNGGGDSAYSNVAFDITPLCPGGPPDAPTDLTAKARGKDKIALKWKYNSNNEDAFKIYRGLSASTLTFIETVGANTTSYLDSDLASKTTYYYKVCAPNTNGENCSDTVNAKTK